MGIVRISEAEAIRDIAVCWSVPKKHRHRRRTSARKIASYRRQLGLVMMTSQSAQALIHRMGGL
jgi:hypothetical protein